jgi:hypothetical protein
MPQSIHITFQFEDATLITAEMLTTRFHELELMRGHGKNHWENCATYSLTDWQEGNLSEEHVKLLYLNCMEHRLLSAWHHYGNLPWKSVFSFRHVQ